jgi:alkanesulfonate monooxygenase SsuD/methylene tetrahydromethanopterin reductase-like flavin-dependent oxidoreductase (luciferase family)
LPNSSVLSQPLYPGRIALGVGRAPGTDQRTMRALRRNLMSDYDAFPQDVLELIAYLGPLSPEQPVRAVPGTGLEVPIWILGSSLYGAQLAAALGFPTRLHPTSRRNSLNPLSRSIESASAPLHICRSPI